jgi:hypothetical protein
VFTAPFALSLSKGLPLAKRCFDKLSTNGAFEVEFKNKNEML